MLTLPISLALLTACSMACGQILFKLGAKNWGGETISGWIISFVTNPFLVVAVFLYAFTIIIWIYTLRVLPLSIAYPITALSYVIVPIISYFFLQEKVTLFSIIGSACIIAGVLITHMQRN